MALCKVYRPSHGPGSDMPLLRCASASSARKRKSDAVHYPEEETHREMSSGRARKRQLQQTNEDDDDAMLFAQILESEMELLLEQEGAPTAPGCQDQPEEADDEVMEISLDEFLGRSPATRASVPPCTAQPENAAASGAQASRHGESTGGDIIKFTPEEELMGNSAATGEQSATPSPRTDDDKDDDMCGLACPAMDDAYVKLMLSKLLNDAQFDPALVEEFITDL